MVLTELAVVAVAARELQEIHKVAEQEQAVAA
jgi:hypothetical protein